MNFILEAGPTIYPVLAAGAYSVLCTVRHARAPCAATLSRLIVLALLTLMLGTFGAATGLQAAVSTIGGEPEKWRFLVGWNEALNNFVIATAFVIVDLLLLAVLPSRRDMGIHGLAPGVLR